MSNNIEKSSIIIQKEQALTDLIKTKKKVLTQLKRNKTILHKLKEEALNLQRNAGGRMMGGMMEMMELQREITALLHKVKASKKISAEEKNGLDEVIAQFEMMQEEIEEMTGMNNEEFEQRKEETGFNTDEFDRQRAQDLFDQFAVEVEEVDQKQIRKTYVKLAARFHPDKAKSNKEKEQFHALMQQIVSAYERGDVDELLRLNAKYADVQTLADMDMSDESAIVDFLDVEIDKVQREKNQLEKQLKRVKQEVKNIRHSDIGDMIKMQKDARKYGYETIEDQANEMDESLEEMRAVRDGLQEYLETGVLPEVVEQALMSSPMDEIGLDELLFGFDFDDDDDDDDDELDISPEEVLNILDQLFSQMQEQAPPPKKKRRRRRKKK